MNSRATRLVPGFANPLRDVVVVFASVIVPPGDTGQAGQQGRGMATKSKTGVKVPAKKAASTPAAPAVPHLFRVTLEVNHLERAKAFYEELLAMKARKLAGL